MRPPSATISTPCAALETRARPASGVTPAPHANTRKLPPTGIQIDDRQTSGFRLAKTERRRSDGPETGPSIPPWRGGGIRVRNAALGRDGDRHAPVAAEIGAERVHRAGRQVAGCPMDRRWPRHLHSALLKAVCVASARKRGGQNFAAARADDQICDGVPPHYRRPVRGAARNRLCRSRHSHRPSSCPKLALARREPTYRVARMPGRAVEKRRARPRSRGHAHHPAARRPVPR